MGWLRPRRLKGNGLEKHYEHKLTSLFARAGSFGRPRSTVSIKVKFYRVGIKDSRVEKKNGYLYLPFSAFNLPRGAILNFMKSWLAAFCDRQIDNGNQLKT